MLFSKRLLFKLKTLSRLGFSEAAMTSGVVLPFEEEFEIILVEEEEPEPKVKPAPSLIELALDEVALRVAKPKSAARKSGEPKFTFERGIVVMPPVKPSTSVKPKPQPNGIVVMKSTVKKPPTQGIAIAKHAKPSRNANYVQRPRPSQKPGLDISM